MKTRILYATIPHSEINGKLCAQDGRILVILANYKQVYAEPQKVSDTSVHVYRIEVREDEVAEVNGELLLWRGAKGIRANSQDFLSVPVESLQAIEA